jgi:D-alanine transaminase
MTTGMAEAGMTAAMPGAAKGQIVYFGDVFAEKAEIRVSPDDRGFLLGDGIYEVAIAYNGKFVALDRHMDRLRRSLVEARIDESIADPLETVFHELIERNGFGNAGKAMVYLQVTRGVAPRSHAFPKGTVKPTVYAYAAQVPREVDALASGTSVITRPDMRWSRCDIKVISLMANVLANQEAKENDAFEAVLIRDGYVLEGSHTSFFGIRGGVVHTAPLSNLILPGITREIVIESAQRDGIEVVEAALPQGELESLDEMFLTGTTTEVVPIVRIDGKPVGDGTPGKLTLRIADLYRAAAGIA